MTGRDDLKVECYAGYRGEETPRRFCLNGHWVEDLSVVDRWLAPGHRYFKLQDNQGRLYILRHDEEQQHWTLVRTGGET